MALETLKNGDSIEITSIKNSVIPVTSKTINSGMINEKKVFNISGRVRANKPTIIGSIKVSAKDNAKFLASPSLNPSLSTRKEKTRGVLDVKKKNTIKDDKGNIVAYNYDLIYTGFKNVTKSDKLKYNLKVKKSSQTIVRKKGISKVITGSSIIKEGGTKRQITVYGDPGVTFKIGVSKFIDGKDTDGKVWNSFEKSILNEKIPNQQVYIAGDGSEYSVIRERIDKSGKYSFIQEFPKATEETRYAVHLYSKLIKGSVFKTNQKEYPQWGDDWYSRELTQYMNPTLTLRATKTVDDKYRVNGENVDDLTYDLKYQGIIGDSGVRRKNKSIFTVTYTLESVDGSTFSLDSGGSSAKGDGLPVFSNEDQAQSDWTNSVASGEYGNGGTTIDITRIAITGIGTTTAVLSFNVFIERWGTKDVTLALDLDTVINI